VKEIVLEPKVDADELKKDLAFRAAHKVPPGYKDASKEVNASGDLLVWRAILEVGSKKKDVVFVSGEEKSDWWHRTQEGPLYPRYELAEEFRRASGGKSFHIIRLAQLLEHLGAKPEVVDDVRVQESLIQDLESHAAERRLRARTRDALHQWAMKQGFIVEQEGAHRLVLTSGRGTLLVRFNVIGNPKVPYPWLRSRIHHFLARRDSEGAALLIVVTEGRHNAMTLVHRVTRGMDQGPRPTVGRIVFGYLENDEFVPFAERRDGRTTFEVRLFDSPTVALEERQSDE
jgi:hypothetical protein